MFRAERLIEFRDVWGAEFLHSQLHTLKILGHTTSSCWVLVKGFKFKSP